MELGTFAQPPQVQGRKKQAGEEGNSLEGDRLKGGSTRQRKLVGAEGGQAGAG